MSTRTIIKDTINATAETIYQQIAEGTSQYETDISTWCDHHGLNRLEKPRLIVARQAAFNLLLKGTLYEQYHQCGMLPALSSNVRETFRSAKEVTNDRAFGEYVLDRIAWLGNDTLLEDLLEVRFQLLETTEPIVEIGRLFEKITPQEARRKLGQFRTPAPIAELMATWLIDDGSETVLDLGVGAGALSAAVYQHKQQKTEEAALSDIHGVDRDKLALVMASTSLMLCEQEGWHNLHVGDFMESTPEDVGHPVDAVISNPPYSRHHELSGEYKNRINAQVEAKVGRDISARSPMYAYFYYHAAQFLTVGGKLSFVTPTEFLETNYGETLKQFLQDEFHIDALVLFNRNNSSKFDEAMTTSVVSFLRKADETDENGLTQLVRVDGNPSTEELLEAVLGGAEGNTDWGFINVVQQDELAPDDKWTNLFDPIDIDTGGLTPLSELATVNRGIVTGKNEYFCLSQTEVEKWNIDEKYLSKIIRRSASVPGYDYRDDDWAVECKDGKQVWLLYHLTELSADNVKQVISDGSGMNTTLLSHSSRPESDGIETLGVIRYLQYGLSDDAKAHTGYVARNREPWFVVDRRDPLSILATYMSRGECRFIRNETDARLLSNLLCLYLDVALTDNEEKALLAYLNSTFANEVVRRSGRTYASGMEKVEPNELEGVPVLDPRGLDELAVREFAGLFDALREAARDGTASVDSVITLIDQRLELEVQG